MFRIHTRWVPPCIALLFSACVLAPEGLDDEQTRLADNGTPYLAQRSERELPELSARPTWRELLQRAFLTHGEIEAAWQEWRAAVARVTGESTWPSTNVEIGFEHMFSPSRMSAWERTSLGVGFDPDTMLELPFKTELMGKVALADARAAGERFRAAKFALQRDFLERWVELARLEEEIALKAEILALQSSASSAAERAAVIGSGSASLVRTKIELAVLENEILGLQSSALQAAARLRGIAHVTSEVVISARDSWPLRDAPPVADDVILAHAALSNPALTELARAVEGREDALELARAAWWPNISPRAGLTGSVTRFFGASFSLPVALPRVRAEIEQAKADLARYTALAHQGATDVNAAVTAELLALREAERAHAFLKDTIIPLANELSFFAGSAYAGGTASQMEWIDAMRAVIDARLALLAARAAREVSLARLEEWMGIDWGTLVKTWEVSDVR
ncbi:MAG: TolC family protein [Planctomycetes bacterium]|nr:TolC family protein [Planctomycetota bacterium]